MNVYEVAQKYFPQNVPLSNNQTIPLVPPIKCTLSGECVTATISSYFDALKSIFFTYAKICKFVMVILLEREGMLFYGAQKMPFTYPPKNVGPRYKHSFGVGRGEGGGPY